MDYHILPWILFCSSVAMMVLQWRRSRRNVARLERKATRARNRAAAAEQDVEAAAESLHSASELVRTLSAELETERRVSQERFDLIDGVLREKQDIWRLYRESARQAGVAQQWLLREYTKAIQVVNAYRKREDKDPIQAPPQLQALLDEFKDVVQKIPDEAPSAVATKSAEPS